MDPKAYWVGFNLVKCIGAARLRILLDFFGSLESAWNAEKRQLLEAGLGERVVDNLLQLRRQVDLERIWGEIERKAIKVVTVQDETYPRRLKEIDLPPPVLYIQGKTRWMMIAQSRLWGHVG